MSAVTNPVAPLNFRDVGGLPTESGALTRRHVLYRSDTLYRNDAVTPLASVWPPAAVIDLRRDDERTEFDMAWSPQTRVHRLSLLNPASVRTSTSLTELYTALLEQRAATIGQIVAIAAGTHGPLLVHCAAGKDRTGIVTAVLLRAAGVTRDAVMADYLLTGSRARRRPQRTVAFGLDTKHPEVPDEFFDVSKAAIGAVLDVLDEDGAAAWVRRHGGGDVTGWQARLIGA